MAGADQCANQISAHLALACAGADHLARYPMLIKVTVRPTLRCLRLPLLGMAMQCTASFAKQGTDFRRVG